jgi:hypothetical protein
MVDEIQMAADFEPKLTILSVELAASSSADRQFAFLIYADDDLVAVLARLQCPATVDLCRSWILEASYGPCSGPGQMVWHDLGDFHRWVLDRCRAAAIGSELHLRQRVVTRSWNGKRTGNVERGMSDGKADLSKRLSVTCTEAALEDSRAP